MVEQIVTKDGMLIGYHKSGNTFTLTISSHFPKTPYEEDTINLIFQMRRLSSLSKMTNCES